MQTVESRLAPDLGRILRPEFSRYTADELLRHMHARTGVEYFPVVEPEQARPDRVDAVLADEFTFNGETHALPAPIDWLCNPSGDVEWHILLHKFYYAAGLGLRYHRTGDPRYVAKWVALTDSWIRVTPPGFIAADVTGRRVQNWIYAHHYFVTRHQPAGVPADFYGRFLQSIHEQVSYLRANLHAARNHRTLELYAIFLAGVVFPELADAHEWRRFALEATAQNVRDDLLADGVQCELSTDYHHTVLRNWLCVRRLSALNDIAVPADMDEGLVRALEFSMHAHKPDGEVPSFSDGDVGSYLDLLQQGFELYGREDMRFVASGGAHGEQPEATARGFGASGYYLMRSGWGSQRPFRDEHYLMFDAGPLGAGNHGHFDCLSFEMAACGRSLIVDPGRYTYDEAGPVNWRARFRGTASHNTVTVDARNQTRYEPGPTKMKVRGPAPEVSVVDWQCGDSFAHIQACARSSEYPVVHERAVHMVAAEYWIVCDDLLGTGEHDYDLRFQLEPGALDRVRTERSEGTLRIIAPNLLLAQPVCDETTTSVEAGQVSRCYGQKQQAPVLRFRQRAARTGYMTVLHPYLDAPPSLSIRQIPVWREARDAGPAPKARAYVIQIGAGPAARFDHWFISFEPQVAPLRFGPYRCDGRFAWVRKSAFGDIRGVHLPRAGSLHEVRPERSAAARPITVKA